MSRSRSRSPSDRHRRDRRDRDRGEGRRRSRERHKRKDDGDRRSENPQPPPPPQDIKTEPEDKQGPNFETSGKLLEDTNTFNGIVVKYSEPPEARKPKRRWRFYVFKGEETMPTLHLHRQSAFLMGRDRKVVDLPIDHPSCSKQHAVLQYRLINKERGDGSRYGVILPYVIDLGSSNGTYLNNQRIEAQRYYELKEKDVLKFGFSSREYVLLHDESQ